MERSRLLRPLLVVAGAAWALLALSYSGIALPELCLTRSAWFLPSAGHYAAMLAFLPLPVLAAGWMTMVAAMMLPLLFEPLIQVRSSSFKRVQPFATGLFVAGYFAVWLAAGPVLLGIALTLRIASGDGYGAILPVLAMAAVWQMSPWKQAALNRCHGRPALAAFGPAAYRDSLFTGVTHGGWCLASCWGLMLATLIMPTFHLPAMFVAALYVWAERLEHPRELEWNPGVPTRLLRALAWHMRSGVVRRQMASALVPDENDVP